MPGVQNEAEKTPLSSLVLFSDGEKQFELVPSIEKRLYAHGLVSNALLPLS